MKVIAKKLWNNVGKRGMAITLAIMMVLGTIVPSSGPRVVHAAGVVGPINVSNLDIVLIRDEHEIPITNTTTLNNQDQLNVKFDWSLNNALVDADTFEVEIDPIMGVLFNGVTGRDLVATVDTPEGSVKRVVGTYDIVTEDNVTKMIFHLTDTDYISNTTQRHGYGNIQGKLDRDDGPEANGTPGTITVMSTTKNFLYESTQDESSLKIDKNTQDGITKDALNHPVQKFTAQITAQDGDIKNVAFTDTPGANLINPSQLKITTSTVPDIANGTTFATLADLNTALAGITLKKNQTLKFEYTMEVDPSIKNTSADDAKNKNTLTATYKKNTGVNDTATDDAKVTVTPPNVDKTGTFSADGNTATWTITVHLNDYEDFGMDQSDITKVLEKPSSHFNQYVAGGIELNPADITWTDLGNGNYSFTYTTTIKDEYKGNVAPVPVSNDVEVTIDGKTYTGHKDLDKPGIGYQYTKAWDGQPAVYDATLGKWVVTWKITLPEIPEGLKDVILIDNAANSQYNPGGVHALLGEVIVSNGKGDVQTVTNSDGTAKAGQTVFSSISLTHQFEFKFDNDYIENNVGNDIVVTIKTAFDESTETKTYRNYSSLTYNGTNAPAKDADYTREFIPPTLTKDGAVKSGNTLEYKLQLNIAAIPGLEVGAAPIIIKDQLPDGLKYTGTATIRDMKKDSLGTWGLGDWEYTQLGVTPASMTPSYNSSTNVLTFTIPVDAGILDKIEKIRSQKSSDYVIEIVYTAVPTAEEFNSLTGAKEYTNTASATYKSNSLGTDDSKVTLTPGNIVSKTAVYNTAEVQAPFIKYTVEVNPDKMKLSADGKIKAKDSLLGNGIAYADSKPIKVYKKVDSSWTELTEGTGAGQYSVVKTDAGRSLEFVIPDEEYIKIEYYGMTTLPTGAKLTAENSGNEFNLTAYTPPTTSSTHEFTNTTVVQSDVQGLDDNVSINIIKYWNNNGTAVNLDGTYIDIQAVTYNKVIGEMIPGEYVYENIPINSASATNGKVLVAGLRYDQLYAIYEKTAAPGFELRDTFYFYVLGQNGLDVPSDVVILNDAGGTPVVYYENQPKEFYSADVAFNATKTFNGQSDMDGFEFSFDLTKLAAAATGDSLSAKPTGTKIETVVAGTDGKVTFTKKASYTSNSSNTDSAKTYVDASGLTEYYMISEAALKGAYTGIQKDESIYIVKIDVAQNAAGDDYDVTKTITKYTKDAEGTGYTKASGTTVAFANTSKDASITLDAKKTLDNATTALSAYNGFQFRLKEQNLSGGVYSDKASGVSEDQTDTDKNGSVTFSTLTYTNSDVGKIFWYKISEVNDSQLGIKYDDSYYLVKVEVNTNPTTGAVAPAVTVEKYVKSGDSYTKATGTFTQSNIAFANEKIELKGEAAFSANKTLNGSGSLGDFTFEFQVDKLLDSVTAEQLLANPTGTTVTTGNNNMAGAVTFTDKVEFSSQNAGDIGTHYYKISEKDSTYTGITKDDTYYVVKIVVAPNTDGDALDTVKTVQKYTKQQDGSYTASSVTEAQIVFANTSGAAELELTAEKTMDGSKATLGAYGAFTFDLQEVEVVAGNYQNKASGKQESVADSDKDGTVAFAKITYDTDDIGNVYYYKISENSTNPQSLVGYDKNYYIVKVNVLQNALTGGVYTVNGVEKYTWNTTTSTYDKSTGSISGIAFNNTNETLMPVDVTLEATKTFEGGTLAGDDFEFELFDVTTSNTSLGTKKNNATGAVTFDKITYSASDVGKTFTYKIVEKEGTKTYITYDATVYYAVVEVTADYATNEVKATVTYHKTSATGSVVEKPAFANTKSALENAEVELTATKSFTNGTLNGNDFEFVLTDVTEGANTQIETKKNDATGAVTFSKITYTESDCGKTFVYKITEKEGSNSFITYDTSVYYAVVVVTKDEGNNKVKAELTYHKTSSNGATVTTPEFTNVKAVLTDAKVQFGATKTLEGDTLAGDDFEFVLTDITDGASNVLETVKNTATGAVTFSEITYTAADVDKTFTYTIKEKKGSNEHIIYDATVYYAIVAVTKDDANNKVETNVTYHKASLTGSVVTTLAFQNEKTAIASTDLDLSAQKSYTGGVLAGDDFEFTLTNVTGGTGVEMQTKKNAANGTVSFDTITYSANDIGKTFRYTVTEKAGNKSFIHYDSTVYYVLVVVSEDTANSKVKLDVEYHKDTVNGEVVNSLAFTNEKDASTDVDVILQASKNFINGTLNGDDFEFVLTDVTNGSTEIETKKNAADGTVKFSKITYTAADVDETFTYKITEKAGNKSYISYDSTEYYAVVAITEDVANNKMKAEVTYHRSSVDGTVVAKPELVNVKDDAASAYILLDATKKFTNGKLVGNDFEFVLSEVENGVATPVETVKNTVAGAVTFSKITYTAADANKTFLYQIEEKAGTDAKITYDKTIYYVIVTVEEDTLHNKVTTEVEYRKNSPTGAIVQKIGFVNKASKKTSKNDDDDDSDEPDKPEEPKQTKTVNLPATGDFGVTIYVIMAVVSFFTIVASLFYQKRMKRNSEVTDEKE